MAARDKEQIRALFRGSKMTRCSHTWQVPGKYHYICSQVQHKDGTWRNGSHIRTTTTTTFTIYDAGIEALARARKTTTSTSIISAVIHQSPCQYITLTGIYLLYSKLFPADPVFLRDFTRTVNKTNNSK